MQLPDALREAMTEETARVEGHALATAAAQLTERYKRGDFHAALSTAADRAAYLSVRMPATYAAVAKVFGYVRQRMPDANFRSLLDIGAGPGTVMWAASGFEQITCVERNQALIEIGQRLAANSTDEALRNARWISGTVDAVREFEPHDLVTLSYVLGEISEREKLLRLAWLKAKSLFVLIEPGTPEGFQRIHQARAFLLESGAHLVAPCPHAQMCPMFAQGDWCHFAARLERTGEHRRLKGGALGYEDEKYSYVVASKQPVPLPDSRVLRHPLIPPGHMKLTLCRPEHTEAKTITKSQKPLWRYARKIGWGDEWQPPSADASPNE